MIKKLLPDFFINYLDSFSHAETGARGLGFRIEKLITPAKRPAAMAMLHIVW